MSGQKYPANIYQPHTRCKLSSIVRKVPVVQKATQNQQRKTAQNRMLERLQAVFFSGYKCKTSKINNQFYFQIFITVVHKDNLGPT